MKFIPSRPFTEAEREREKARKRALIRTNINRGLLRRRSRFDKPMTEASKRVTQRILGEIED